MATYAELYDIRNEDALLNRIATACAVQANVIRAEDPGTPNHANRVTWAKQAFSAPRAKADQLIWALLAANNGLTVAQIRAVTDAQLLAAVANVVDVFADGS